MTKIAARDTSSSTCGMDTYDPAENIASYSVKGIPSDSAVGFASDSTESFASDPAEDKCFACTSTILI